MSIQQFGSCLRLRSRVRIGLTCSLFGVVHDRKQPINNPCSFRGHPVHACLDGNEINAPATPLAM